MKKAIEFLKSLSVEDFAFEIFGTFLVLNFIFYFFKYYDFKIATLIFFIVILSWIVYFVRLKEELSKNPKNED